MKRRHNLALIAALLLFLVAGPTVASPGHHLASWRGGIDHAAPSEPARRDPTPQLVAVPEIQRVLTAATAAHRRTPAGGARVRALVPNLPRVVDRAAASHADGDAESRRLRTSNTPCCVRGPPTAS